MSYVMMVEFRLSIEGSLFFKLKKKKILNVGEVQEDSEIFEGSFLKLA